jgi:branched-chain amino acid transport system ATP-binding protein
MENILEVKGLGKSFGGFTALSDVNLSIRKGERLGLIGPNGSGKTTLISCISGSLRNDQGSIHFLGEPIESLPAHARTKRGIARSFQIPRPFHSMTVLENLLVPLAYVGGVSGSKARSQAREILGEMGLADKADSSSASLSQVELRKMELARAMAAKPQLLISDEAMAGLSGSEVDDVLDILIKLNQSGITIIMIEHIMHAVMRFSERLVCLDTGQIISDGHPQTVVSNPQVHRAYLGD